MKKVLTVILFVCMLGLTGCMHMVEITDEESETIARTAAWLLFKYDNNYKENLVTPTPTEAPSPTPTDLPTPTPEVTKPEDNLPPVGGKEEVPGKLTLPEYNVKPDALLGIRDIHLVYDGYEVYDSYMSGSFSVETKNPQNGLMFVFLKLENERTSPTEVNLLELQPKCVLYVNEEKKLAPKKTVLLNDFQYLSAEIPASGSYSSVLVFEVEKPFEPERLDLYLSIGEDTAYMKLQ